MGQPRMMAWTYPGGADYTQGRRICQWQMGQLSAGKGALCDFKG